MRLPFCGPRLRLHDELPTHRPAKPLSNLLLLLLLQIRAPLAELLTAAKAKAAGTDRADACNNDTMAAVRHCGTAEWNASERASEQARLDKQTSVTENASKQSNNPTTQRNPEPE
jgi:hypothetical protein